MRLSTTILELKFPWPLYAKLITHLFSIKNNRTISNLNTIVEQEKWHRPALMPRKNATSFKHSDIQLLHKFSVARHHNGLKNAKIILAMKVMFKLECSRSLDTSRGNLFASHSVSLIRLSYYKFWDEFGLAFNLYNV